jgi:hypothetical protein
VIGERPETNSKQWDAAARAYAIYNQRWNPTSVNGQLPNHPSDTDSTQQHADHTRLRAAIIEVRAMNSEPLTDDQLMASRRRPTDRLQRLEPRDPRIQEGIIERLEMKVRSAAAELERAQSMYDTESTNAARRRDRNAPERSRRQLMQAQRQLDVANAHLADEQELRPAGPATAALKNRVQLEVDVIDKILSMSG